MIDSEHSENVVIFCSPTGIDSQLRHPRKEAILRFEDGQSFAVPDAVRRRSVCGFSEAVKHFCDTGSPKILPPDDEEAAGFGEFMRGWEVRRWRIDMAPGR